MAIVTGELNDFGIASLAPYSPEIIFTPSGPAVTGVKLLAARPIVVIPAENGTFSVNLSPTDIVHPASWYTISIQWLNPDGGYIGRDFAEWQLLVPGDGGAIGDLVAVPSNPAQVWVSETAPINPTPGTWWYQPSIGNLSEWS